MCIVESLSPPAPGAWVPAAPLGRDGQGRRDRRSSLMGLSLSTAATTWLLKYVVPWQTAQKQQEGLKLPTVVLRQGCLLRPSWRRQFD